MLGAHNAGCLQPLGPALSSTDIKDPFVKVLQVKIFVSLTVSDSDRSWPSEQILSCIQVTESLTHWHDGLTKLNIIDTTKYFQSEIDFELIQSRNLYRL